MFALLTPTPDSVSAWVEAMKGVWSLLATIGVGLGGAWVWFTTLRRREREERRKAAEAREERRQEARRVMAARFRFYHAGAELSRFLYLQLFGPREKRLTQEKQDERAAILAHELVAARDALWIEEGRRDPNADPEGAAEDRAALRSLTITRRFAPPFEVEDDE